MGWGVRVHVWGDYALFARPEMKVERCSYDVMPPSAAHPGGNLLASGNAVGDRQNSGEKTDSVYEHPKK